MPAYRVTSGKITDLELNTELPEEAAILCVELWLHKLDSLGLEIVVIPSDSFGGLYKYNLDVILQKIQARPKKDWVTAAHKAGQLFEQESTKRSVENSVVKQLKLLAGEAYAEHKDERAAILRQALDELTKS